MSGRVYAGNGWTIVQGRWQDSAPESVDVCYTRLATSVNLQQTKERDPRPLGIPHRCSSSRGGASVARSAMGQKERNAKFRRENPDYQRRWREANREKSREYTRRYDSANREKRRVQRNTPEAKAARSAYNRAYYLANKHRWAAKHAVPKALERGELTRPDQCSQCGRAVPVVGHHDSYAKEDWLAVRWLCDSCHGIHHAESGP